MESRAEALAEPCYRQENDPMTTSPQPPRASRATWYTPDGTAWRVELVAGRWQLSRYSPASETWQRVGSYPNRKAAISAAYGETDSS